MVRMPATMKFLILAVGVLCSFTLIEGMPSAAKAEQAVEEVDLADRIVGGTQTDRNKHPYIVSLKEEVSDSYCQQASTSAPTPAPTPPPTPPPTDNNGNCRVSWRCRHYHRHCPPCWWKNHYWNGHGNNGYYNNNYYGGHWKRANDGHFCAATLVKDNYLVTAAHCVDTGSCYKVVIDEENRGSQNGKLVRYAKATQHENYNSNTFENDIAVMELTEKVDHFADAKIDPLPLAATTPSDNAKCTVAGWGRTSDGGSQSNSLRDVEVPIVPKKTCKQSYGDSAITDGMICAGLTNGGKDSCQGDSGGPFVCKENGQKVLSGVVSWGSGCAQAGSPGVYTNVSKYRNWIQNKIN